MLIKFTKSYLKYCAIVSLFNFHHLPQYLNNVAFPLSNDYVFKLAQNNNIYVVYPINCYENGQKTTAKKYLKGLLYGLFLLPFSKLFIITMIYIYIEEKLGYKSFTPFNISNADLWHKK